MSIAFEMSASFSISTKPNPRERPVILSMMIDADVTGPTFSNASFNSASVEEYGKPPMYNLFAIYVYFCFVGRPLTWLLIHVAKGLPQLRNLLTCLFIPYRRKKATPSIAPDLSLNSSRQKLHHDTHRCSCTAPAALRSANNPATHIIRVLRTHYRTPLCIHSASCK